LLCCDECGCVTDLAPGWIAHLVGDHESSEGGKDVTVHCPVCAQREFEVVSQRGLPYT
jgi:hypothetical protein